MVAKHDIKLILIMLSFLCALTILMLNTVLSYVNNTVYAQAPQNNNNSANSFNTLASGIYKDLTLTLGNSVKNLVILIPNEAHEPPGLEKELRVINQPYVPQNVETSRGTTIVWFGTDIPHNHRVAVIDKNSKTIFDSGVIKFNTASKPLKLNESGTKFVFYEPTKNPKYPNFVLNGTITVVNSQSSSNSSLVSGNSTNFDTVVTYMVPANELHKRISEFKNLGFGINSTYPFKSLRGGGSEAGGDKNEFLMVLTSSGKELSDVISALKKVTATMPYT